MSYSYRTVSLPLMPASNLKGSFNTNGSHWDEISSQIPCPINFTDEELETHYRDGEGWNEQAEFWDSLEGLVHRDGWTSKENYNQALQVFAQLREEGLQNLTGEELREFEQQTWWASKNQLDERHRRT